MDAIAGRLLPVDSPDETVVKLEFSAGVLNVSEDKINENIRINIRRGLPQVKRYYEQPEGAHVALVGGGPSLAEPEIKRALIRHAERGGDVIATNNSAAWLVEHDIRPSGHVIVDARAFNRRFVEPPTKGCKYFLSSQVAPEIFDYLIDNQAEIFIWHGGTARNVIEDMEEIYGKKYTLIKVGSTVMLAAIWVMWLLGYRWVDMYGFDSCLLGGNHHAYSQPENDRNAIIEVKVNGKLFYVHPWMWAQFQDFLKFCEVLGEKINIRVHGDGLIAYALEQLDSAGELKLEEV